MAVYLTDAPGDILSAEVTIESVTAVRSNGDDDGTPVLTDSSFTVDLTTLQGGVTELMGEVQLDPGTYSQIRLKTAREATVLYEDSSGTAKEADLQLPSADQTGLKINFNPVSLESEGDRVEITLDFSVEDSFVSAGASGKYIFKPVVRATTVVRNDNPTSSGN